MKFYIENHTYAPELSKLVFLNGVEWKTGKTYTSIKEARQQHFYQCKTWSRHVVIKAIVPSNPSYNRTYSGVCNSYKTIIDFMRKMKEKHNIEGSTIVLESIKSGFSHV